MSQEENPRLDSALELTFPWEDGELKLPVGSPGLIRWIEPSYPPLLSGAALQQQLQSDLAVLADRISAARRMVIILEDSSRPSITAALVEQLVAGVLALAGRGAKLALIIAAGAHYHLDLAALRRKTGNPAIPYQVHDCTDRSGLVLAGTAASGIPLWFNRQVAEAELRFSISTVILHPLAGFSGGGKNLLPGVAGLDTIRALHGLPPGRSGDYNTPMRDLINQALDCLPIHYSWQLVSRPDGAIVKISSGELHAAHRQAMAVVKTAVTKPKPPEPGDLVLAGCAPFNQNLIGTFKALPQLPALLKPGGTLILFNEASEGRGAHHWRNDPAVVAGLQAQYADLFRPYRVILFAPRANPDDVAELFPRNFSLIREVADLTGKLQANHTG